MLADAKSGLGCKPDVNGFTNHPTCVHVQACNMPAFLREPSEDVCVGVYALSFFSFFL